MEKNRLSKILAASGVASRRKCEELIFNGKVSVDDETVLVPQTFVDPHCQKITVNGQNIKFEEKVYIMLNKPRGYTCTHLKKERKKIVYDLLKGFKERLFSIGRLDRDTSGLLLFTNDGHFANQIIHPSSNITKEYLIKTKEQITDENLKTISKGVWIEDRIVRPCKVRKVRKETLKIGVKEGKKHEVRLLILKAGLTLVELKRIRIGGLVLSDLEEGEYRPLTEKDKAQLFSS